MYDYKPFYETMTIFRGEFYSTARKLRRLRTGQHQFLLQSKTRVNVVHDETSGRELCAYGVMECMRRNGGNSAAWGALGKEVGGGVYDEMRNHEEVVGLEESMGEIAAVSEITIGHEEAGVLPCTDWPHLGIERTPQGNEEEGDVGKYLVSLMDGCSPSLALPEGTTNHKGTKEQDYVKGELRKEKNREAAKVSNGRKRDHRIWLQTELKQSRVKETNLRNLEKVLREENVKLKNLISTSKVIRMR